MIQVGVGQAIYRESMWPNLTQTYLPNKLGKTFFFVWESLHAYIIVGYIIPQARDGD